MTIVDCIADTHGHFPELEGGDLLIVAGDLTTTDTEFEYRQIYRWLELQPYRHKIVIAGNHDNWIQKNASPSRINRSVLDMSAEYLCDSGTEFEGLRIWGSPWALRFPGMNPHCMAFTVDTEEELAEKWALIPEDIDILVTHSPPHTILDHDENKDIETKWGINRKCLGSSSLYDLHYERKIRAKLHVYGHIHEGYGHISNDDEMPQTQFVNASHVNERYEPVNKPIRIVL